MNKITVAILLVIACFSLFLNVYKQQVAPPCINADEAAFNYNAYSILQTGKDEYGTALPLRLKSFGDFKMPLYTYLSVPVISIFGLHDYSARYLNNIIAFLFPIVVYLLVKELFKKTDIALVASFLVAASLGLHLIGRHAHEAYLTAFLITTTMYFLLRLVGYARPVDFILEGIFLMLSLFSYQSSRIFALFIICYISIRFVYQKAGRMTAAKIVGLAVGVLLLFSITDIIYKPERVKNLLFITNSGFVAKIIELRGEGGPKLMYNKAALGMRDLLMEHLTYFSPQFLAVHGDSNIRFGFPQMSPMTVTEYIFIFVGLYYLFKHKEKWRFFLVSLWLLSPISASLSWQTTSLTRSLFLLVPSLILTAYGVVYLWYELRSHKKILYAVSLISVSSFVVFYLYSWDFYLNHYPKRALITRTWQCGYKELTDYVKTNYSKTDTFYITRKNGEPYIFLLFFLNYPPARYQNEATLTAPDEYGFGQIEKFDKYQFHFTIPSDGKRNVIVGYPDDFQGTSITEGQVKKIKIGTEEIFWIYEQNTTST
ncbi:MAG: hypothetical protein RI947_25 [Candidatus Parcubacteria bacterium]|jgi:4-amino-4-deoxy-L-arabinose transferase-like glycosyltransferase